jgi:hypothetical protein
MLKDAKRLYIHPGTPKAVLMRVLGSPDGFSGYDYDISARWDYATHQQGSSGDGSILVFFDSKNRVVRTVSNAH